MLASTTSCSWQLTTSEMGSLQAQHCLLTNLLPGLWAASELNVYSSPVFSLPDIRRLICTFSNFIPMKNQYLKSISWFYLWTFHLVLCFLCCIFKFCYLPRCIPVILFSLFQTTSNVSSKAHPNLILFYNIFLFSFYCLWSLPTLLPPQKWTFSWSGTSKIRVWWAL